MISHLFLTDATRRANYPAKIPLHAIRRMVEHIVTQEIHQQEFDNWLKGG